MRPRRYLGLAWIAICMVAGAPAAANDALVAAAKRSPAEVLAASENEEWRPLDPANTRYLDRNLSVFGRLVQGQEHLQQLPRGATGSGVIEEAGKRGKILRMVADVDVPEAERTELESLRTDSASFAALIAARRNRPEEFFVYRPDHIDVCGVPVPMRPAAERE